MDVYKSGSSKGGIPLDHLDFKYIEKCSNTKELEKILKELRTGEEGYYPDLERCVEEKLLQLDPACKTLRKDTPIMNSKDLGKQAYHEISADIEQWSNDMHSMEAGLKNESAVLIGGQDHLPPIRGSSDPINTNKAKPSKSPQKSRPVKPRDYRDWDKLDVEAELAKVDEPKKPRPSTNKVSFSDAAESLSSSNLTDQEKSQKAECEKNKGNEAFRAGDHEEALFYYNRSIELLPTIPAHNNRAQTYVKLKRWHSAVCDCDAVLKMDAHNIKAHLRRAVAYQGQRELVKAAADLKFVLDREANNKRAEELLKEVNDALAEQKVKGRRMVIEEVEGSEESEVESEEESEGESEVEEDEANEPHEVKEAGSETSHMSHTEEDEQADTPSDAPNTQPDQHADDTQPELPNENTTGSVFSDSAPPHVSTVSDTSTDSNNGQSQKDLVRQDKQTEAVPLVMEPPTWPDAVSKLKERGNVMFRQGQYGEAMHVYTDTINALMPDLNTQSPNMSVLYTNRAACRYKSGDCGGCVEDCSQALQLTPAAIKPLVRRAMAYEALEKFRLAYVDYRQVLNMDQTVDVAQQGATRCGQMLSQQDGPRWRERLPPIPSTVPQAAYQYPAPQQTEQQKRAEAEKERQRQLKTERTFIAEKKLGNECVQKAEFEAAVEHYTKCVELCPDQAVAFTNRALCYLRLQQPHRVIDDCNNALLIDFGNTKALFRRAQAYKMLDKYEESLIDLQTLLKIDSKNATARKEVAAVERSKEEYVRRRREEQAKKPRLPVHIQPVDVSSDEEDTPSSPPTSDTSTKNHTTNKVTNSSKQKAPSSREEGVRSAEGPKDAPHLTSPTLNKATPYEFVHAWTSLKGITDTQPYVQLLQQISPDLLPKVVSNKLDGSMLVTIVRAIDAMISSGVYNQAFLYLSHLTKVPRFNTIALFLSVSEKTIVRGVFKQLADHITADSVYTSQQLKDVQLSYTL